MSNFSAEAERRIHAIGTTTGGHREALKDLVRDFARRLDIRTRELGEARAERDRTVIPAGRALAGATARIIDQDDEIAALRDLVGDPPADPAVRHPDPAASPRAGGRHTMPKRTDCSWDQLMALFDRSKGNNHGEAVCDVCGSTYAFTDLDSTPPGPMTCCGQLRRVTWVHFPKPTEPEDSQ